MKTVRILILLSAVTALSAQSVETIPFRAVLTARAETTPIVDTDAAGFVNVWVHVVRDASGKVTSGSIDFGVGYRFTTATTLTAMHIHRASAGVAGPIVVGVPLTRFDDADGAGAIPTTQVQFASTDATTTALDAVNALLTDPSGYYFNVHTANAPAGAMRGQLQRAEMVVLMGMMSPANEVPPIQGLNASGIATVVLTRTLDSNFNATSASVIFDVDYTGFPEGTEFTGFHIHFGRAGANGPVTLDSGITGAARIPAGAGGGGNLRYEFDVNLARALAPDTVAALFNNPEAAYINLHTAVNPTGAIRAQMHRTSRATIQVTATPQEEVSATPITIEASAPATIHVYTLHNPDGSVPAGAVIFDVNPRFPAGTTITAMHIHDAVAGLNGPVRIDSKLAALTPPAPEGGTGNIFRVVGVTSTTAVASLNSLVQNPERHYLNVHTTVYPGGAVRGQLAPATTPAPSVSAAISSVSDITRTTAANKSLMSIYGSRLTKVSGTLDGFLQLDSLPKKLNGTSVTVNATEAGLVLVAPDYMVIEVPAEVPEGNQPLVVTSSSGASQSFQLTVRPVSPNIFFDSVGGIVTKADFSLVRPDNAAAAGDVLAIFSTGNGQTTPALATARVPPLTALFTAPQATVTIGGRNAEVIYSVAAPGFAGLYQTGIRMPAGVPAGRAAVQMTVGGVTSNTVNINVR